MAIGATLSSVSRLAALKAGNEIFMERELVSLDIPPFRHRTEGSGHTTPFGKYSSMGGRRSYSISVCVLDIFWEKASDVGGIKKKKKRLESECGR